MRETDFRTSRKSEGYITKKMKVGWENTHRLLQSKPELYKGIKTGITDVAGPCLASLINFNKR